MGLWDVSFDSGAGQHVHKLAHGFGHSLLVPVVADVFEMLRVSAFLWEPSGRWWRIHSAPNLIPFELEHGLDRERIAYNAACIAKARRQRRAVRGSYAGYSDSFVPVVSGGHIAAVVVIGPFATTRPTSLEILGRWRALTGRQGHPTDPEFAAYLSTTLGILVLDDARAALLDKLVGCLATLLAGDGDAGALANEAEALRVKLEPARSVERNWDVVRSMVDERAPLAWASASRAWHLSQLGLPHSADHVVVGLTVSRSRDRDPVDDAVRRNDFQRASVRLAHAFGNAIAGQVGDHGVAFLLAGKTTRKAQRVKELVERAAALARRYDLVVHFGASAASRSSPLHVGYTAALAAAERALNDGVRLTHAEGRTVRSDVPLRRMRLDLGKNVVERAGSLRARFDRYLEAVEVRCGYRLDAARGYLDAGFERVAEPLLDHGALDSKSFDSLSVALDKAAIDAHTLSELFAAYRRAIADMSDAVEHPGRAGHDRSLRRAVEFIHQHYTEPLGVRTVAKIAGFAPNYFSKLFREREGTPFARYVVLLRLERAKQLLRATDLPATWIAEQCGFRSSEYFSRVFRRATGATPLDYRRGSTKVHRQSEKSP